MSEDVNARKEAIKQMIAKAKAAVEAAKKVGQDAENADASTAEVDSEE